MVYLVDGSIAFTGAFACARNMARALEGIADVVLVLPKGSTIREDALGDFRKVYYLDIRNLRRSPGAVLLYLPFLALSTWQLRSLMRRDGAARLVLNDFYLMQGPMCRLLGYRGQIFAWVRIDPQGFGHRLSRLWLGLVARSADRIVAVSRHIQTCLPAAMETSLLYDALDRPSLPHQPSFGRRRLVYIGNYIQGKGQDDAIEAFALLAEDYPDLELEFHGSDMGLAKNRAWRDSLVSRAEALGLAGRISFGEFAADPKSVLSGGFLALNFSRAESFSMTVLEASAAGLPVIATRSGGPAEIIVDGETGLLVPVGDIMGLAAAIRVLVNDPLRAAAMGSAAQARVQRLFSMAVFRKQLVSLLGLAEPAGMNVGGCKE